MKKRFLIALFVVFIFLNLKLPTTYGNDYSIPNANIEVILNKDGSAKFVEDRTYSFDGSFTFGYYDLPKEGYNSLEEFLVYEGEELYKKDNSRNIKTYFIEDKESYYRVNFYYSASNQIKTFTFVYKLKGVVKVYEDYGEFYWKLQGDKWDKKIENFESNIKLLSPIPKDNYFVWAHGPLWGQIDKVDDTTTHLKVENVPKKSYVEVRMLIPSEYFTNAKKLPSTIKGKVLDEEKKWSRSSNIKRVFSKIFFILPLVIFILLILLFIFIYSKYGKEHKILKDYEYIREPPSNIKPAVLGHLLTFGAFNDKSLKATIMDLIHRGIIKIENDSKNKRNFVFKYNKDVNKLGEFEKILVENILFDESEEFKLKELNKKLKKYQEHYYNKFEDFKKEIKIESDKYDLFDKQSEKKMDLTTGIGVFILILSILLTFITSNFLYLTWLIAAIIYFIGGVNAIRRRSYKGKEEYDKWMAFKRFLNNFSNLKEYGPKSVVIWEKYLVYGTILGVSKTVLRAIKVTLPQIENIENGNLITFYGFSSLRNFDRNFNFLDRTLSRMTSSMSAAYKTSKSSFSSGFGGGGGFSGGGGGGGGGSGGGMG